MRCASSTNRVPGAPPLRVVLDTNIYIAGFNHPRGRNAKLWSAARDRRYQLLVSVPIIREIAEVLRGDFAWPEPDLHQRIRLVAQVAEIVITRTTLDLVPARSTTPLRSWLRSPFRAARVSKRFSQRDGLFGDSSLVRPANRQGKTVNGTEASVVSHRSASVPLFPPFDINSKRRVSTGAASVLRFIFVRPKSSAES